MAVQRRSPEFLSGLRVEYDPEAPPGARLRSLELADGRPVLPDGRYRLEFDFLPDILR